MAESEAQRPEHQRGIPPGLRDAPSEQEPPSAPKKPRQEGDLVGPLDWLIDAVASIKASVRIKLLSGFLLGALLLLGMGILSLVIISRMSGRVTEVQALSQQVDLARQMEYDVTAQSHFRAMALLTKDDTYNDKIAAGKSRFEENLIRVEAAAVPDQSQFFSEVWEANDRFSASSAKALALYQGGNIPEALGVHLEEEHPISHELESAMREMVVLTTQNMESGVAEIQADHRLVSRIVGVFATVSIGLALSLGFVLSWSFVRPVSRMGLAMRRIASGDFSEPVRVKNKDELGELADRINQTAEELARLQEATLAEERARALQERITHVTLAQEEERRRISRELHDGLGPSLAAIGNRLRACQHMVRTDPQGVEGELEEITKGMKGHVQEIRDLIYDLRPLVLDQLGLVEAVKQQVEQFGEETGVEASFSMSGDIALNPLAEVTVLRIVQECLSNVQKHAKASEVEVRLQGMDTGLEVRVQDNGQGFDPRDAASSAIGGGMGILSMQERAELLKGSLTVQGSPGSGCLVVLYIPSRGMSQLWAW